MSNEDLVARVGRELQEWAKRFGVLDATLAKAREYLPPDGSRNGVPFKELKLEYGSMELVFDQGVDDMRHFVRVKFSIRYKKPRFRDRDWVGSFDATFTGTGFLSTCKFTLDDDLLRELRKPPVVKIEG